MSIKDYMIYNKVAGVEKGSIAEELGVKPGDVLIAINGELIRDVFDYRMRIMDNELKLRFYVADEGVEQEVEVEKDDDENMGLIFEEPLMDKCSSCHNNCVFCFIRQLPANMRETLYFRDDDARMSFLTGNYVTLTNLNDDEFERMLSYRLSPINVSVHTTNPRLRCEMLNNRFAGNIMDRLLRIKEVGLEINCQFVLCPGINDGEELISSIEDLATLGDNVKSIAVVPVGLTKFRDENNLPKLKAYDEQSATKVLEIVEKYQKLFEEERGTRLLYAADEFYLRANRELPEDEAYEDYPQLENGVGIIADFKATMDREIERRSAKGGAVAKSRFAFFGSKEIKEGQQSQLVWEITGTDAQRFHQEYKAKLDEIYSIDYEAIAVKNNFFGESITVTGLLTGGDILACVSERIEKTGDRPDLILISSNSLKADEDIFLDDMTLMDFGNSLNVEVLVRKSVEDLFTKLDRRYIKKVGLGKGPRRRK